MWSCGVILYILLSGSPPFSGDDNDEIMKAVSVGIFDFNGEEWIKISESAKDLISKMLTFRQEKRLSAQESLDHSWISENSKKEKVDLPVLQKALVKMGNFSNDQKLQDAFWNFFVMRIATREEKNELMQAFKAIDKNNDGQLSKEELLLEYTRLYGETKAIEEVNSIMEKLDKNNSGTIDYSEFISATIDKQTILKKKRLEQAFSLFDDDGSGLISVEELKKTFGGIKMADNLWEKIIKEVDVNGDGQISMKEFTEMMAKMIENDKV